MNYGNLLYEAHQNHKTAALKSVPCYKTSFSAPKKLERPQVSSETIKKFLAKKEEENKKKKLEAKKKKEELLAFRSQDKNAQKRIHAMLKLTKSANKSVMEDAIDNVNTRDTLDGPQCDEDDYGYVSQEATDFYAKMMNKYANMPPEPSLFSESTKNVKDLAAAKDRVRAALQKEEANLPYKRKKKKVEESESGEKTDSPKSKHKKEKHIKTESNKGIDITLDIKNVDSEIKNNKIEKKKCKTAPPIDFNQLLQLAELKQHEPIVIDPSKIQKEPERLMTQKEKDEYLREKKRKEIRNGNQHSYKVKQDKQPKLQNIEGMDTVIKVKNIENKDSKIGKHQNVNSCVIKENVSNPAEITKRVKCDIKRPDKVHNPSKTVDSTLVDIDREIELLKKKRMLLTKSKHKTKSSETTSEKSAVKNNWAKIAKRKSPSDSEHDSELDDFIDEGPEREQDYSKYISEIFGYDKSKYSHIDDECKVSNFARQMKEEFMSTKIGILEDLEDIKKEREEKIRSRKKHSK